MADRARSTFPIAVEFVDGELPSATKLNGLSRQAKQSSNLIEFMLGDVWNQSGDSLLQSAGISENALMISNMARYLGASKNINPRIPYLPNIEKYTHKATTSEIGEHELLLEFPVKSGSSYVWTGTGAPSGGSQATKSDVVSSGQWYVDKDTGQIFTYDAVIADWDLTYEPIIDGDIGDLATWNVIPDPDTDVSYAFQGVKIQYVNTIDNQQGYLIFLPPRGPLDSRRTQKSPQKDTISPNNTKNFQSLPSTGDMLFWQDDTVDAVDSAIEGEHYRYTLPKIITDSPSWGKSVAIPQGLVYLWDPINTGTIIEGIVLSAENASVPRKYVFVAQGGNLDTWISSYGSTVYSVSALQDTSHAANFYPTNGLRVITIGSSVSDALSSLFAQYLNHDHSSSNSISTRPVLHNKLKNLFDASGESAIFSTFNAPTLINDDHPQYLHRYGSTAGSAAETRDKYKNSMLGDLLIASTDSSSNHINTSADTYRLRFGTLNNVSAFYDQGENALRFDHVSNTNPKFDFGVDGESNSRFRIECLPTRTRMQTKSIDSELSLQAAGNLRLDAGLNSIDPYSFIEIGKLFNNSIEIGDPFFTKDINNRCSEEYFIRAGDSGSLPTEQPTGNGIRVYSQNRLDIAAGNNAPTISASGDDIFIRSGDDFFTRSFNNSFIEAYGNINITADYNNSGSGNINLSGRSIKATLVSSVTEDIIVPIIGGQNNNINLYWNPTSGQEGWRVPASWYGGFTLTLLPHDCTLNNIQVNFKVLSSSSNVFFDVKKHVFGVASHVTMGSDSFMSLAAGTYTRTITTGSFNTNISRSTDTIFFNMSVGGGTAVVLYPGIKANVTYSKLLNWPAQT